MSLHNTFWIVFTVLAYSNIGNVWAYEGGPAGSATSDPCSRVLFSEFNPRQFSQEKNNTEVAPQSEFSFMASKETFPKSIAVTIEDETVPIAVTRGLVARLTTVTRRPIGRE